MNMMTHDTCTFFGGKTDVNGHFQGHMFTHVHTWVSVLHGFAYCKLYAWQNGMYRMEYEVWSESAISIHMHIHMIKYS